MLTTLLGAARAAPVTLSIAAILLGTQFAAAILPGTFEGLIHSDTGLASGEVWRLATGHLVHLDGIHLGANLAALLALGLPLEREIGSR
ncbi:MAG: rhomboid family intramembrane serine protease, partial [Pseudomonadota bacterium]